MCCFPKNLEGQVRVLIGFICVKLLHVHAFFGGRLSLVGLKYERFWSVALFCLEGGLEIKRRKIDI